MPELSPKEGGDRIAKVMARAGACSRRTAEAWIRAGRVKVNGKLVQTPAFTVSAADRIEIDDMPLAERSATRLWLYHKPAGLIVTENDPEGRETIYAALAEHRLPRFLTVGRLDVNTEGLLLLTNDGGLKRVLELPSTGWLRRYRVRAFGRVTQETLDELQHGITVDKVHYGAIEAKLEREQGDNVWMTMALREGKNREIKNVLESLGLAVNRLIRISYGPFQLGELRPGEVSQVRMKVLKDQLGTRLAEQAGVDFDAPVPDEPPAPPRRQRGKTAATGADRPERSGNRDREDRRGGERSERPPRRDDSGRPRRSEGERDGHRGAPRRSEEGDRPYRRPGSAGGRTDRESRGRGDNRYGGSRPDRKRSDESPRYRRDRPGGDARRGDAKPGNARPGNARPGDARRGDRPRPDGGDRPMRRGPRPDRPDRYDRGAPPRGRDQDRPRKIHFQDGRPPEDYVPPEDPKARPNRDGRPGGDRRDGKPGGARHDGGKQDVGKRPARKPGQDRGDSRRPGPGAGRRGPRRDRP